MSVVSYKTKFLVKVGSEVTKVTKAESRKQKARILQSKAPNERLIFAL